MIVDAGDDRRLQLGVCGIVNVVIWHEALSPGPGDIPPQFVYLFLHLCMLATLADAFEVGLDFAVQL